MDMMRYGAAILSTMILLTSCTDKTPEIEEPLDTVPVTGTEETLGTTTETTEETFPQTTATSEVEESVYVSADFGYEAGCLGFSSREDGVMLTDSHDMYDVFAARIGLQGDYDVFMSSMGDKIYVVIDYGDLLISIEKYPVYPYNDVGMFIDDYLSDSEEWNTTAAEPPENMGTYDINGVEGTLYVIYNSAGYPMICGFMLNDGYQDGWAYHDTFWFNTVDVNKGSFTVEDALDFLYTNLRAK